MGSQVSILADRTRQPLLSHSRFFHRHTLKLVLRGEWPKLSPATKTHLSVTLQRCASHLVQHPAAPWCTALIALVHNPWTHPALDSILNGQPDSEHEEGKFLQSSYSCPLKFPPPPWPVFPIIIRIRSTEFCCSEKGELLTMRLKILCEDRCEDIAVNLAAACVRSLRRSDRLRSLSDSHHVHYMIDVYIVLLYKLKRTQDIFAQVSSTSPSIRTRGDRSRTCGDPWTMTAIRARSSLPPSSLFLFFIFILL